MQLTHKDKRQAPWPCALGPAAPRSWVHATPTPHRPAVPGSCPGTPLQTSFSSKCSTCVPRCLRDLSSNLTFPKGNASCSPQGAASGEKTTSSTAQATKLGPMLCSSLCLTPQLSLITLPSDSPLNLLLRPMPLPFPEELVPCLETGAPAPAQVPFHRHTD